MQALDWIGKIIEWIGSFIPRLLHIKLTHAGVMFTRANAKTIGPGIHVYIPFWSSPEIYPTKRQTLNLPSQVLTTKDLKSILIDVAVVYDIKDIYKALVDTYDLETTIRDISQGTVKDSVVEFTFEEINNEQRELDESITKDITEALEPYGINVVKAFITDLSAVRVFRIAQSTNNFTP